MTWRPRLLPTAIAMMALLSVAKLHALLADMPEALPRVGLVTAAHAGGTEAPPNTAAAATQAAQPAPEPEQRAERELLENLRARRAELDAREQALAARELVLQAAERRLAGRAEEVAALQRKLEAGSRAMTEREEAGWRQLVKLYEGMRPRDAAAIFDELDMPVLVELVDRMREAKAAPVLGAMRPERARLLTAELARHRARVAE